MPNIYEYLDFRKFLRDFYEENKLQSPTFSFQSFARKAHIASSGFQLHVMKGERNLTRPVMLNVARAMKLSSRQIDYFEKSMIDRASQAWDYFKEREIDMHTVTCSVSSTISCMIQ
jgi:uncharacterized protein (TIGR02147 family)